MKFSREANSFSRLGDASGADALKKMGRDMSAEKANARENFRLRNDPWYEKLIGLFSEHQQINSGAEFVIPEDCPADVGQFFITKMQQAAHEQGLEATHIYEEPVITESVGAATPSELPGQPTDPAPVKEEISGLDYIASALKKRLRKADFRYTQKIKEGPDLLIQTTPKNLRVRPLNRPIVKTVPPAPKTSPIFNRQSPAYVQTTASSELSKLTRPQTRETRSEKKERGFDGSPEFEFFSQLYIQGMEPEEMEKRLPVDQANPEKKLDDLAQRYTDVAAVRAKLTPKDWNAALESFCKLVKEGRNNPDGFDPAARMMAKITHTREGLTFDNLNADTRAEADQNFVKATQELWQDFYYSGRWRYSKKRGYYVGNDKDMDAKTTIFLAKKAGILDILNNKAQALAPSEHVPGATTFDSGLINGIKLEEHPDGTTTLVIDNHPAGRTMVETSAAKIVYRLFAAAGLVDGNDPALRAMVELSVADDNARLVTNQKEFSQSDRTLRGLHKFMVDYKDPGPGQKPVTGEERLYRFFTQMWPDAEAAVSKKAGATESVGNIDKDKHWWAVYTEILNKVLKPSEIQKFGLSKAKDSQRGNIDAAWEMLNNKSKQQLIAEGRVVVTKWGDFIVDIADMETKYKRMKGGHEATQAFNLAGRIAFDGRAQTFMVNTLRREVDLSKIWKLDQGVPVRGAMVIKPNNGVPLKFGLKEILDQLAPGYANNPKGIIKDYLENGPPKPEPKTVEKKIVEEGTGQERATVELTTATKPEAQPSAPAPELASAHQERDEEIEKQVESLRESVRVVIMRRGKDNEFLSRYPNAGWDDYLSWVKKTVDATLDLYRKKLYANKANK